MPATTYTSRKRPEQLIEGLFSPDPATRLKSIKDLKNQIIGSRSKKLLYLNLGTVERIVEILKTDDDQAILIQSAAVLGSFAFGSSYGVEVVMQSGGIDSLLQILSHKEEKVVISGGRSLKTILQSKSVPQNRLWERGHMNPVISLLKSQNPNFSEMAAMIISHTCQLAEHQRQVAQNGGILALLNLLGISGGKKIAKKMGESGGDWAEDWGEFGGNYKKAALVGLVAVVKGNAKNAKSVIEAEGGRYVEIITEITRDKFSRARLQACLLFILLSNTSEMEMNLKMKKLRGGTGDEILEDILGILVRILEDSKAQDLAEGVPEVLEALLYKRPLIRNLAVQRDLVVRLGSLMCTETALGDKRTFGVLASLAVLCNDCNYSREKLTSHKNFHLVPVVPLLTSFSELLTSEDPNLQVAACEALSNIAMKNLMEFNVTITATFTKKVYQSTSKQSETSTVVEILEGNNLLQKLRNLIGGDSFLTASALRVLRNLAVCPQPEMRDKIFKIMNFGDLFMLLKSENNSVVEQTLALLRNLLMGSHIVVGNYVSKEDKKLLIEKITSILRNSPSREVILQALYVLANLASSGEKERDIVVQNFSPKADHPLGPQSLLHPFLQDPFPIGLKLASIFLIQNLCISCGDPSKPRVRKMIQLGLDKQLTLVASDPFVEIKVHANHALYKFQELSKQLFGNNWTILL